MAHTGKPRRGRRRHVCRLWLLSRTRRRNGRCLAVSLCTSRSRGIYIYLLELSQLGRATTEYIYRWRRGRSVHDSMSNRERSVGRQGKGWSVGAEGGWSVSWGRGMVDIGFVRLDSLQLPRKLKILASINLLADSFERQTHASSRKWLCLLCCLEWMNGSFADTLLPLIFFPFFMIPDP